jgi:flotillin
VRRPADAEAYKQRTLAEAERDGAKFSAEGEAFRRTTLATAEAEAARIQADAAAYAARATAAAQADANRAQAASLAGGNQELIAASRIVEALPSLATAAAQGISSSNLTILNGAEGVGQVVTGLVGQGLSILDTLRHATAAAAGGNGQVAVPAGATAGADGGQVATAEITAEGRDAGAAEASQAADE